MLVQLFEQQGQFTAHANIRWADRQEAFQLGQPLNPGFFRHRITPLGALRSTGPFSRRHFFDVE